MRTEKNTKVRWIDMPKPTEKDLAWLKKEFGIHPLIIEELRKPSIMAHVDAYKDYLYFVYYFPQYDEADGTSVRTEIDILITKDAVITIRYEGLDEIFSPFRVKEEANSLVLVSNIFKHLVKFEERQLRHIREKIENIGRDLFKGDERNILERLTYLKRDISEYRIIARLQEIMVRSLLVKGRQFWGGDAELYLNDIVGEQLKITSQLEDYRDTVSDFEETNNQLMNLKINHVVQRLTALSFIAFPVLLIAGLFTMGAKGTPIVGMPNAFWIILGGMAIIMLCLFAYFKRKKWL